MKIIVRLSDGSEHTLKADVKSREDAIAALKLKFIETEKGWTIATSGVIAWMITK